MLHKWERREAKEEGKKRFSSDNRNSIRLISLLSVKPNKLKRNKRIKIK